MGFAVVISTMVRGAAAAIITDASCIRHALRYWNGCGVQEMLKGGMDG